MSYLLDTHGLLWSFYEPHKLSEAIKQILIDENQQIFVSIASLWEIAIKINLGKLKIDKTFDSLIDRAVIQNRFEILPIKIQHLQIYRDLPLHHRDPFDRLLVSQAITENHTLISCDPMLQAYPVTLLW